MPTTYSYKEYADLVFVCGLCNGNGRAAVEEYERRYPHRMVPHHSAFAKVYRCWMVTGSCPRAHRGHVQQRHDDVLDAVQRSPTSSVRRILRTTGVPRTRVWRILHSDGLYPYHLHRVQHLLPRDYAPHVEFCEWLQANLGLLPHILFTDEATFTRDGINNTRNSHTWAHQNPRNITVRRYQHRYSVNVWRGLIDNYLIRPHFKGHLTGASYREFLQSHLPLYLEDVLLAIHHHLWMRYDGAPPHTTREVTALVNQHFADWWLRRGGPVPWPPQSPYLSPLDFFVWGCMKSRVYLNGRPDTREQLMQRTNEAAVSIRNELVSMQWMQSLEVRLVACVQARGGHFEQYIHVKVMLV
jgi:hypothetical protein